MNRRTLWLAVALGGAAAALLGTALGALALLLGVTSGEGLGLESTLPGGALVSVALGLGIPLAWTGWAGWRGRAARPFTPRAVGWIVLGLVVSLGLGAVVTTRSLLPRILLPPIHAAAMGLPPVILLWLTGRALRGSGGSWREVVASLGGGGLLGTTLSFAAEAIVVIAVVLLAALVLVVAPGGTQRVSELIAGLRESAMLDDAAVLRQLLANPTIALAAIGILGVAVPLIEESLKTLAVGVVGAWVRPHGGRAFLWGVASGAGFAIAESLLNGAMAGQEGWIYGALTRAAASVMHCFTGGLVGWAWGQLWEGRRVLRFLASLAGAAVLHGVWNTIAVAIVALAAVSGASGAESPWQIASGAGTAVLAGLLGILATGLAVSLPLIGRRLAAGTRSSPADVAVPSAPSSDPRADG